MKMRIATVLLAVMMSVSVVACGNNKVKKETESEKETGTIAEEVKTAEETLENDTTEEVIETDTTEEETEISTEFKIPVQENFVKVEGLSDNYADLDNRSFAYNGKVFTLGKSTLKDLIEGGIPFDNEELNNKGNNVNSNYQSSRYTVRINDYTTMQFVFVNITDEPKTEEECLLSTARFYFRHVPQPDYDARMNEEITANIIDAGNKVCFSFPITLTKEQLLENNSDTTEQDDYNNVYYNIDSEVYWGKSGYTFEFNDITNQMEEVLMDWLP